MAWDVHIADVVTSTAIVAPWGNEIRDRVVHPIPLFANLPVLAPPNVVNGDVAFAGDTEKWYGLVGGVWTAFNHGKVFDVDLVALTGDAGITFEQPGDDQGIQIAADRKIQAYSVGDVADILTLNPLGGPVQFGATNQIQVDPTAASIWWSTAPSFDGISFDDALNNFEFHADGAAGHIICGNINAAAVTATGALTFTGTLTQGIVEIIDGTGVFVGPSVNTSGNVNAQDMVATGFVAAPSIVVGGSTVLADNKLSVAAGELLIHNEEAGAASMEFRVEGANNFRFKGEGGTEEVLKMRASGGFSDIRFTALLPSLGGTLAIGVVAGEHQLGLVSSMASMKENIAPVGRSKVWELNPVRFNWIKGGIPAEGFLAEELAEVDRRLANWANGVPVQVNNDAVLAEVVKGLQELKEVLNGARLF